MDGITERMKKYAEAAVNEPWEFKVCREHGQMLSDLQATMQALEVAREALSECHEAMGYMSEYDIPLCMPERTEAALKTINKILEEK
jgi:hypothetical protein